MTGFGSSAPSRHALVVQHHRDSLDAVQDAVIAEMADLQDLTAKYEYLIGLGRDLRVSQPRLRRPEHAVAGCQSRVWIRSELRDGHLHLAADSDALITRGLIALVLRLLDGRTPAEILAADLRVFEATGLQTHLSPSRANGLNAMIGRIREEAERALRAMRDSKGQPSAPDRQAASTGTGDNVPAPEDLEGGRATAGDG